MPNLVSVNWLDLNSMRSYPLDDAATCRDIKGQALPQDIVVDLNLWFPGTPTTRVYVSSVTVTPGLVSLTLCAADGGTFSPLAALAVPRPVDVYRNYQLTPYIDGAAGWVIFGNGANRETPGNWVFNGVSSSGVLPRVAQPYATTGVVTSLHRSGYSNKFTGVVKLVNRTPDTLAIAGQDVLINGSKRRAIVFSLVQPPGSESIFTTLAGPCGGTPDSNTCARPPILAINGATPDCNGTIFVNLVEDQTDTDLGQLLFTSVDGSRIVLDYELGMTQICGAKTDKFTQDKATNCDDPCSTWSPASPLPSNP